MAMKFGWKALAMRTSAVLAGCLLWRAATWRRTYKVPATPQPATFKETGPWVQKHARQRVARQAWWKLYNDSTLNGWKTVSKGPTPPWHRALARYDAAQAFWNRISRSCCRLSIGGHANADKQSATGPCAAQNQPNYYGDNMAAGAVFWDLDLWAVSATKSAAGKAEAQASFADLAGVRLSLQAELADNYLQLRGLDDEARLLQDAITIYGKALTLTNERQ